MVELLGEGEIVGLVNGAKSIFFDQTPVENEDGDLNFKGVTWEQRTGLPDQEYVNGTTQVETPVDVGTRVYEAQGPILRTINEQNADSVRVITQIPALVKTDDDGNITTTSLEYYIDVRPINGDWSEAAHVLIYHQKCTSPFYQAHVINLPRGGCPWDIRVRRITPDADKDTLQNELYFDSYVVLTKGRFTYPNTAFVYIDVDSEQFGSNLPARSFHVKGLKIAVPSNYDPDTRAYTGVWDGTFRKRYTNNPAWIFYDLITNDRYGLGEFIDAAKIDKWGLYQIAQYCDEQVPSGYNSSSGEAMYEPRFVYNGVINTRDEAYTVLQNIVSAFRGMAYWSLGQVFAVADMPSDPVQLVSPANVINGQFEYSGTAMKARHSVAVVAWNDPEDFYRQTLEPVINDAMLQRFGWRETQVTAYGCTSRGQAHRFGKWILDVEQHETETVEYTASWDHARLKPGNIIAVADPRKAQVRAGGRIVGTEGTARKTIVLDSDSFTPASGQTYQLMLTLPSGDVEARNITGFDGNKVTVNPAFAELPRPNAMYVISGTDVHPREYRVLSVAEDEKHTFKITALFHDPTKYARVEYGLNLPDVTYTRPKTTIKPPTNLTIVENQYYNNGTPRSRITLSWTPTPDFASVSYNVRATTPGGAVDYGSTKDTSIDIDDVVDGDYVFYVSATSVAGIVSKEASLSYTAHGWAGTDNPWVTNLAIKNSAGAGVFSGRDVTFTWTNNFPKNTGANNPFFKNNVVTVKDTLTGDILRTETITTDNYTYSLDSNLKDNEVYARGASRKLTFSVTIWDVMDRSSETESIDAYNPPPSAMVPTVQARNGAAFISWSAPASETDFAGTMVWWSLQKDIDPLNTAPYYDGSNTAITIPTSDNVPYWVRIAGYDVFSKNVAELTVSAPLQVIVLNLSSDASPPTAPTNLKVVDTGYGLLDLTWTNPPDPDLENVELWYNTTNDIGTAMYSGAFFGEEGIVSGLKSKTKYYVWARAIDVTGNYSDFTASVNGTTDKLVADDYADGSIKGVKITDESITAPKLAAVSVTGDKIKSGAITSDKIAAGAVVANSISANAVTSDKIKADTITANHIVSNTLQTKNMQYNSVTSVAGVNGTGQQTLQHTFDDSGQGDALLQVTAEVSTFKNGTSGDNSAQLTVTVNGNWFASGSVGGKAGTGSIEGTITYSGYIVLNRNMYNPHQTVTVVATLSTSVNDNVQNTISIVLMEMKR
ncbi:TipJ family phage tail tip protein [Faunimonas pinastri]|nr:phage tail protein [Faunimonas pinastri]